MFFVPAIFSVLVIILTASVTPKEAAASGEQHHCAHEEKDEFDEFHMVIVL